MSRHAGPEDWPVDHRLSVGEEGEGAAGASVGTVNCGWRGLCCWSEKCDYVGEF